MPVYASDVDAQDDLGYAWHLDPRCTVDPEAAVKVKEGRAFRWFG